MAHLAFFTLQLADKDKKICFSNAFYFKHLYINL